MGTQVINGQEKEEDPSKRVGGKKNFLHAQLSPNLTAYSRHEEIRQC